MSKEYFFTSAIHGHLRQVTHKTIILQSVFCRSVIFHQLTSRYFCGKICQKSGTFKIASGFYRENQKLSIKRPISGAIDRKKRQKMRMCNNYIIKLQISATTFILSFSHISRCQCIRSNEIGLKKPSMHSQTHFIKFYHYLFRLSANIPTHSLRESVSSLNCMKSICQTSLPFTSTTACPIG